MSGLDYSLLCVEIKIDMEDKKVMSKYILKKDLPFAKEPEKPREWHKPREWYIALNPYNENLVVFGNANEARVHSSFPEFNVVQVIEKREYKYKYYSDFFDQNGEMPFTKQVFDAARELK